jgi:putative transposon-encoded protein
MFYFNDKMTFTNKNGEYELDKNLLDFIISEVGKESGKEEIYQYLLDHSVLEKETVVQSHGNSARLSIPKSFVGKHVRYWIAILPDIKQE